MVEFRVPIPKSLPCDPTQRSRGNPITLNLDIYNDSVIYIIFVMKNCFGLEVLI